MVLLAALESPAYRRAVGFTSWLAPLASLASLAYVAAHWLLRLRAVRLRAAPSTTPASSLPPPSTSARPIVVLYERNPWLLAIGSDTASFAAYDDGLVIFGRSDPNPPRVTHLEPAERDALLASLGSFDDFFALRPFYDTCSSISDQPICILRRWKDGVARRVEVRGSRRGVATSPAVPGAFRAAFQALIAFDHPRSVPWPFPIEVLFAPWPDCKASPLAWPEGWPEPHPMVHDGVQSVYMAPDRLHELQHMATEAGKKGRPIAAGGHHWSVTWRFPIPNERAIKDAGRG